MRTLLAVAMLAMALVPFTARANPSDDAEACKPDVFRLCSSAIPWKERIVACLHEKKRQLSSACLQVFNRKPVKTVKPAQNEVQPSAARWEHGSLQ